MSRHDSKGLNYQDREVLIRINKQSPDIAGGLNVDNDDLDVGAGHITFGYSSGETEDVILRTGEQNNSTFMQSRNTMH